MQTSKDNNSISLKKSNPTTKTTATTKTRLKFNLLGATMFEYVSQLYEFDRFEGKKFHLDDEQLKKLNSIWSNLPFDVLKQEYEKKNFNIYLLTNGGLITKRKKGSTKSRKSTAASHRVAKSAVSNQRRNRNNNNAGSNQMSEFDGKSVNGSNHRRGSVNSLSSSFSSQSGNNKQHTINSDYQITIHVCDEVKRLKQDFSCPRDLLVTEMRYFNSSLVNKISSTLGAASSNANGSSNGPNSAGAQQQQPPRRKASLDDIDISVHCDITIFDWLMRYVKRWHPTLIEKSIISPADKPFNETTNKIVYSPSDGSILCVEPLLETTNAISILLSSDFLVMNELREKCLLFICNNLEAILQVPCVFSSIPERLLAKLAACVPVMRLFDLVDRKDKIKTRLFQRKIEFLFDTDKLRRIFETSMSSDEDKCCSSYILNEWRREPSKHSADYLNYLYECENDASTLFKCKLCNRFMTRAQSSSLSCTQTLLDRNGELIYMHCSDDRFDLIGLLRSAKEQLKTWPAVYWFVWSLIKSFRCKKCLKWFRLVDANRCRINEFTLCSVHDSSSKPPSAVDLATTSQCTCMFSEHLVDPDSVSDLYAQAPFVVAVNVSVSAESSSTIRASNYVQYLIESFNRVKDAVLATANFDKSPCDLIEEQKPLTTSNALAVEKCYKNGSSSILESIVGRSLSLINKNTLILVKQSYLGESTMTNPQLDLKTMHVLAAQIDPINISNNILSVFSWLKIDPKMKWDQSKPIRFSQDNQREDDLRRLREISNFLVKLKLGDGDNKTSMFGSGTARTLATTAPNVVSKTVSTQIANITYPGGMYCRIENEWKQRIN